MKNDLRFAFRMLAAHRWFSLAVIVTLALGIGINTTVFTLVNAVLFKPVPLPGGARLVTVSGQDLTKNDSRMSVSYPDFKEFRQNQRSFESLEATNRTEAVISEQTNPPERYSMARISTGLLGMLQTPPILGRGFAEADGNPGAEGVLLIGYSVWKNRYGGDPGVVGRSVRVNGAPATIIGVMPEGFKFPNNEYAWMPLVPTPEFEKRSNRWLQVYGLLKPTTSIEAAGADVAVIAKRLASEFSNTNKDVGAVVRTFHQTFNGGPIRTVFLTMLGAVGFVLLIACANVANLMLSRAISRQREIAVRAALGASRWQIVRQLLVESVLLSVLGGLLGLGLAMAGVRAFDLATSDVGKPYWIHFTMDYVVFVYFAIISVVSGLAFGLAPALRASRVDLTGALKDGSLGAGSASGGKLTATLVVVQFALTVVLLAGAGLMVRSFFIAQTLNSFVPAENIFTARISLPEGKEQRYNQRTERLRFYDDLVKRLGALPGVTHATISSHLPGMGSATREIEIEGKVVENPANVPRASLVVHSPAYLATIGSTILNGRGFNEADGEPGKEVTIVTREFASKHWPNQSVIGARLRFLEGKDKKPGPWITVVGVASDIIQRPQEMEWPPLLYLPHRQEGWGGMALLLRSSVEPTTLAASVRAAVQTLDQDLPLFDARTLSTGLRRNHWQVAVFGSLFLSFAIIALIMASVGLYAVVAQGTARRTREIGIRMALGATAPGIIRLVLTRGLTQLALGLVLGLAGAFVATGLLKNTRMLVRVSPQDPLVFTVVAALLLAIGILACWLPARRAANLHPVSALREE
jgi:putative ABC transport system permease protein